MGSTFRMGSTFSEIYFKNGMGISGFGKLLVFVGARLELQHVVTILHPETKGKTKQSTNRSND